MFMFCSDMNSRPFPPGPDPDADVAAERRRLLLVRQLERLDQMIAAGMDMVQALAAQAAGSGPKVIEGDLILAYSRASPTLRVWKRRHTLWHGVSAAGLAWLARLSARGLLHTPLLW